MTITARTARTGRLRSAALVPLAVAGMLLAGCATTADRPGASATAGPASPTPTGVAIPDTAQERWTLVELTDPQGTVNDADPRPTLDLRRTRRVSGTDGCNTFAGRLATAPALTSPAGGGPPAPVTGIRISDVVSTDRACLRSNGIEARYLDALRGARSMTVSGEHLRIRSHEGTMLFQVDRFVPVQPVQPNDP